MNAHDEEQMKEVLRQALPPVEGDDGPGRDLWPAMLRRMDAESGAAQSRGWAWFDGALLAGMVGFGVFFPAAIPVLLFYL
jgi:hypothetical protein